MTREIEFMQEIGEIHQAEITQKNGPIFFCKASNNTEIIFYSIGDSVKIRSRGKSNSTAVSQPRGGVVSIADSDDRIKAAFPSFVTKFGQSGKNGSVLQAIS